MQSEISSRLKLRYSPVAIVFMDEEPDDTLKFLKGRRVCVVAISIHPRNEWLS
ncbi:MAG: hypothetical protein H6Q65_383 [Firmicutes bacterium]|nr:hypothetical protein [Bacillota bacterium]